MNCERPFVKKGQAFGCGQCLPCRINKRRIWTTRILLESACHVDKSFVTLTYDDVSMPEYVDKETGEVRGNLVRKELQDWFKRLRKRIAPLKVRYFAVGEYGDKTERPHFHIALFGYPSCRYGNTRHIKGRKSACCSVCKVIDETWGKGRVSVDRLEKDSAQYICGYTVKKMTAPDDMRLNGRNPEFATMSLKPGIGFNFMYEMASSMLEFDLENKGDDVPSTVRSGAKEMPMGRYLQRRLRKLVGKSEETPEKVLERIQEELSVLRQSAFVNSRSFAKEIADAGKQKRLQLETREKIFKKRKVL